MRKFLIIGEKEGKSTLISHNIMSVYKNSNFFAGIVGALKFVIASEIFLNKIRGRTLGISILTMWASDAIVGQLMPVSLAELGTAITFWIFAGFSFIAFWVIYR